MTPPSTIERSKFLLASVILLLTYIGGFWPSFLHVAGFLEPMNSVDFPHANYVNAMAAELLFLGGLLVLVWSPPKPAGSIDPALVGLWVGVVLSTLVNLRFAWDELTPPALLSLQGLDAFIVAALGPVVAAIAAHIWIDASRRMPGARPEKREGEAATESDAPPTRMTAEQAKVALTNGAFKGCTVSDLIARTGLPQSTAYKHFANGESGVVLKSTNQDGAAQ